MNSLLKLENVCKTYNLGKIKIDVLKNISLEINSKDFVAILGPSGSGKSTLLNIMSCLDTPTKGKIYLEKKDISTFSEDRLAEIRSNKIGFVFQQFNLLPHLSALENVILPTVFRGTPHEKGVAQAQKHLSSVGLSSRMNHKPSELSGGEKQRVAISRALVNNPEIIVADEPTGNVDSKTGNHIMEILKKLNEQEQRTIIMVTHDNNLINFANKVIKIKDGEIDE